MINFNLDLITSIIVDSVTSFTAGDLNLNISLYLLIAVSKNIQDPEYLHCCNVQIQWISVISQRRYWSLQPDQQQVLALCSLLQWQCRRQFQMQNSKLPPWCPGQRAYSQFRVVCGLKQLSSSDSSFVDLAQSLHHYTSSAVASRESKVGCLCQCQF